MRFRTTVLLGLLMLGIGAYVYFVEFEKAEQEAKKKVLVELDPKAVSVVTLTYPDREIVVERAGEKWRMTKPVDAPADESAMNNLVRAIAECEVKKSLDDVPQDLSPYGLDKPDVVVRVKLADKELPEIRVGKNTPVGFSTYVQRADEKKVYLTSSAFHTGMDKKVADLRDKQVLALDEAAVTQIALRAPDRDLLLTRSDSTWRIEKPAAYEVDPPVVQSFLSVLKNMRANDFAAEAPADLAPYGLATPRLAITLSTGKPGEEKEVIFGTASEKSEVHVKTNQRSTVYAVSEWVFRDVDKNLNDFRDKHVWKVKPEDVHKLEVVRGEGEGYVLVRVPDNTWSIEGTADRPDNALVEQFVKDATELSGYEIAADNATELAPFGLERPLFTIALTGKENQDLGKIRFGSYADGTRTVFTVAREGQPTVFRVRDFNFTRLGKKAADFLPRPTPTAATPGAATPEPEDDLDEDLGEEDPGAVGP